MTRLEDTRRYRLYEQDIRDVMEPDGAMWEEMCEAHDRAAEAEAENIRQRGCV
jgi:hypothetical protein